MKRVKNEIFERLKSPKSFFFLVFRVFITYLEMEQFNSERVAPNLQGS